MHAPVAASHASRVEMIPSLQTMGVLTHFEPEHESTVHLSVSLQRTAISEAVLGSLPQPVTGLHEALKQISFGSGQMTSK